MAGRGFRLDIHRPDLSTVLPSRKIRARPFVCVIEAKARRTGRKSDAPHALRGDERCALLRSSVDVCRNVLAVPVQLFWRVCLIKDVDGDRLAFLETQ